MDFTPQSLNEWTVSPVVFTDKDGGTLQSLTGASSVKATVSVTNNHESGSKDATVIFAMYRDNKLIDVKMVPASIAGGDTATFTPEFLDLSASASDSVKLFIWEAMSGIKPITQAAAFPE